MSASFASATRLRGLYVMAGCISLLLSLWISLRQVIINPDAICYVLSADEFSRSGLKAAMQLCGQAGWPFYSVLISFFSKISSFSPIISAYLIDAGFTLISVLSFITIVRLLGGESRRVLWLAALVILSAHQFNAVRQYIVRDHGFWAFYLLSMICLLRFWRDHQVKHALLFGLSLALAALFRLEGVFFLAMLPLAAFFDNGSVRQRALNFLKLNAVIISVMVVACVWLFVHPQDSVQKLGRLPELMNQALNGVNLIAERFQYSTQALIRTVLPGEAARDANTIWLVTMVVLYGLNVIHNMSWLVFGLVVYGVTTNIKAQFTTSGRLTLYAYLLVNLLVSAAFFAERLFFSRRYLIAMTLVFLLWIPFVLDKLLQSQDIKKRYAGWAALLLLLLSSFGVMMDSGKSRHYLREAGSWMAANIPADAKLYSNDLQLSYYSQHYGRDLYVAMDENRNLKKVLQNNLQEYDYVALRSGKTKDLQVADRMVAIKAEVLKEFVNQHGAHVTIYKMPANAAMK